MFNHTMARGELQGKDKWIVITAVFYVTSSLLVGCAVYHVSSLLF